MYLVNAYIDIIARYQEHDRFMRERRWGHPSPLVTITDRNEKDR